MPSFALLAIVAADLFVRGRARALDESLRLVPVVLAMLFAVHLLFQFAWVGESLDTQDVRQTNEVGAYIRDLTPPNTQIVSLNPTLAVASRRPLASPLLMGQFSFWPSFSDARAEPLGVVNVGLLENADDGPAQTSSRSTTTTWA